MEYLENCGIRLSRFALGASTFGSSLSEAESHRLLDIAHERGLNLIDTAEIYCSPLQEAHYGRSETIIGSWLRANPRKQVFVATKVAGPEWAGRFPICPWVRGDERRVDRRNVFEAVEGSLRRLGVERIDFYMAHWPELQVPLEEQICVFSELIQAGKIRFWGTSNERPDRHEEMFGLCRQAGLPPPVFQELQYSLLNRAPERGALDLAKRHGMATWVHSPLASGVLSGKYPSQDFADGSRLAAWSGKYRKRFGNPQALAGAARYGVLAAQWGFALNELALGWLLAQPVNTVLLGASRVEQFLSNLRAMDRALPAEVLAAVNALHAEVGDPVLPN